MTMMGLGGEVSYVAVKISWLVTTEESVLLYPEARGETPVSLTRQHEKCWLTRPTLVSGT